MGITKVESADDMAALAREAIEQFRSSHEYRDLMAAVLMANHVADWYFQTIWDVEYDPRKHIKIMKNSFREWNVLRKIANGLKHCDLKDERKGLEFEDLDFWRSGAHRDECWNDWFVEVDGEMRSVVVLVETFLDNFSKTENRPPKPGG